MKFTKGTPAALALPRGKTDHIEWDDDLPGLGVRLRGKSKRWVVQYRIGTQQRRESLGDVRRVNLEDARKIARQRFAQVELGADPVGERAAAAARLELGEAVARYLGAKRETLKPGTHRAVTRYLNVCWKPLHGRALDGVKRSDVAARLQELTSQHGRTSAARARSTLSTLFAWSLREGLCEVNPVIGTNEPDAGILPRDRILSDDEVRTVWNACGDDVAGCLVRLLLLTGCRREEIGALQWRELEAGVLTLPGTRTKNGRTLVLPLPALATGLLAAVPKQGGGDFVFGRGGTMAYSGWSATKLRLDARIAMATGKPVAPWTFHDLRRTMRTGLGKIGIPPHVAELCINHVKGGIEAVYDRHRYQREIAAALARWAEHVLAIVEGRESNVVALQTA
jgi:integrase